MALGIGEALKLVTVSIKATKKMLDLKKDFDEVEHKKEVLDLMETLNSARETLFEVQQENINLQEQLNARDEMVRVDGILYKKRDDGEATGAPFCPKCENVKEKMIECLPDNDYGIKGFCCPVCRSSYDGRA